MVDKGGDTIVADVQLRDFATVVKAMKAAGCTSNTAPRPVPSSVATATEKPDATAPLIFPNQKPATVSRNGLLFQPLDGWVFVDSVKYTAVLAPKGSGARLNMKRLDAKGPFADANKLGATVDQMCASIAPENKNWGTPQPALPKSCGLGTCAWCQYRGGQRTVIQAVGVSERAAYIMTWFSLPSDTAPTKEALQQMLAVREAG